MKAQLHIKDSVIGTLTYIEGAFNYTSREVKRRTYIDHILGRQLLEALKAWTITRGLVDSGYSKGLVLPPFICCIVEELLQELTR